MWWWRTSPPESWTAFGLGYEEVKATNPGIIYCSISGFGQGGPYRTRSAYDQIMQGMGGLMSITGEPDGEPQKIGVAVTDIGAGMWAAFGIMSAIHHRHVQNSRSGAWEGQYIDVSMLDAQVAWLTYQAAYYFANDEPPKRLGAAHPTLVPYQAFYCQDGKLLNLAVGSERIWERFCEAIERPDLKDNPDYATNPDRVKNRNELVSLLGEVFSQRPVLEWVDALNGASVPAGPINDLADVFSDPQVLARDMFQEMPHPTLGAIKQTGLPHQVLPHTGRVGPASLPSSGSTTAKILEELGYSEQDVKEMQDGSVILTAAMRIPVFQAWAEPVPRR